MAIKLTLTLSDKLYERAHRLAQLRQQDVTAVVTEVLDEALPMTEPDEYALDEEILDLSEPDEAVDREIAAYYALHPTLWEKYPGYHVAIHGGRLVDYDRDDVALSLRIEQQFPDAFVLIRQVEAEPERVLYFRSPRIVRNG